MAQAPQDPSDVTDRFIQFYRKYYHDEIGTLAQQYPNEQRSLYVHYDDLSTFDIELAEDYVAKPDQMQEYAEEALRLYDLPADVKLGRAHVRLTGLPETVDIRDIRVHDDHIGRLISVQGIVRKATDVRPKITEAAFECQRCGTMTYIPQSDSGFQEPHECQGCERQGPFHVDFDQSEFVDAQKVRVQESPEGLRGGETPQSIDVDLEDDVTGRVTAGDHVTLTGVLHIEQQTSNNEKTPIFDLYMDGVAVEIEDEEFEDMNITEADVAEIVDLSNESNIHELMIDSVAPSIYGYREEKLAMILQLFSGVTKHLPDGSRIRGDLHMLLIGDPGTGKCVAGDTLVTLADGSEVPIRKLVEANLDDPNPVDDGVWDTVDIDVPSMEPDGSLTTRRATKVWKREAPEELYRIRTASGREIEVTPSHPLFVVDGRQFDAVVADELDVGQSIAAPGSTVRHVRSEAAAPDPPEAAPDGGVSTDRIVSIEPCQPDDEWVYDLEIAETHSYLTNGIVSHNSAMLQYIRNIAPRSVYTSGKGSSSAGLCVTGDTRIHTANGFVPIRDLATEAHPDPVSTETSATYERDLYTFDREDGTVATAASSHAWRMPEKACRRIETGRGKHLEASVNTPVLTCGEDGIEWKPIRDVETGDYVAAPKYDGIDRSAVPTDEFIDYTEEKLRLTDGSIEFLRERLTETYGSLRDAAAALTFPENFAYDTPSNRYIPIETLDRILDAVGASHDDITVRRAMPAHGDDVRIPRQFDEDLLYLVGLVFGDGDIVLDRRDGNRGTVRISNSDEALLERAAEIVESTFDKRVEIERQEDRVPYIRLHSGTIARFFSNLGMASPKESLELDPRLTAAEHADAFLRGLMDADGSVSSRTDGGPSIQFSTISEPLAEQVQLILETYGVESRRRAGDRRGTTALASGYPIESTSVQHHLAIHGRNIDQYAEVIGFESADKRVALSTIVGATDRRDEKIPTGGALATAEVGGGGQCHATVTRGDNPGRRGVRRILDSPDFGDVQPALGEAVDANLTWDEVVEAVDTGKREVYDLTVPATHNFFGNGVVTHNTAAAVRDDFGDGQQWTLEAGALVLADKGIAAVDELDKMRCVTGDTLVALGDGSGSRIDQLAAEAEREGTVENLPNGRTIRGADIDVWTMTGDERLVQRPVTAVHEYHAPGTLYTVTLSDGSELTTTADHPFFVFEEGERIERPAEAIDPGDEVYAPVDDRSALSDGGVRPDGISPRGNTVTAGPHDPVEQDVTTRTVDSVRRVASDADACVYDLTVQGTHNFVANGMVVHNSEDRSAMHEALEQQSYHPNSEVLLSDGRRVEIGPFVDSMMDARADEVVDGVDCEILPVDDVGVHTVDLDDNDVQKVPVDRVSRHEAPEEFVRVSFSNGRSVTVTPEHPMFVADDGEVDTVDAADLSEGNYVPAPRKLPNSAAPMSLEAETHHGGEHDVDLPAEMSPDLAEILGLLTAGGHFYSSGRTHVIGFSNQDERLLDRAGRLMDGVFGLDSTDVVDGAGTTKRWASTKLYRWFESNFPEVMRKSRAKRMPEAVLGASEEEIRRFLVGAFCADGEALHASDSRTQSGDGGVESEAMSFSTASPGLAEDYADALLKIGVASRIHHDSAEDSWETHVTGDSTERFVHAVVDPADDRYEAAQAFVERNDATERNHDVLPPSAAEELRSLERLLGVPLDGRFRPNVDEGYGVRISTVEESIELLRKRAKTVRPELDAVSTLAEARELVGWSGRQLAERLSGVTASAVHYAESGGCTPERRESVRTAAVDAIRDALDDAERRLDDLESQCDLRYCRVTDVETVPNEGEDACEWVYDVTVDPTNTFVSGGVVLHNSISVSKAGINATLKSRCSLLGAANPKYGRFDQYEPIGEQIDLEPALISRFDLIFTVTDSPDPETDAKLADHIINTNYAGELHTQRTSVPNSEFSDDQVDDATADVTPEIEAELLRKYVAYAKRTCYPTMTDGAKEVIRQFYVDFRAKGADEDAPVPVTARKLEALVRLSEASARLRLSDTVEREDAVRVTEIVESCLRDIGMDPETGNFDADIVETGTSKSQRDRIKDLKHLIEELEDEYDEGAPVSEVVSRAGSDLGLEESKAETEIENLRRKGEVYEPRTDYLRTT